MNNHLRNYSLNTRILTIIALLFATPAWADGCYSDGLKKTGQQGLWTCDDYNFVTKTRSSPTCAEQRRERLEREAKQEARAKAEGWASLSEKAEARTICVYIRNNYKCAEEKKKYRCSEFKLHSHGTPVYTGGSDSYDELKNRVEELEAEVEQLRNR